VRVGMGRGSGEGRGRGKGEWGGEREREREGKGKGERKVGIMRSYSEIWGWRIREGRGGGGGGGGWCWCVRMIFMGVSFLFGFLFGFLFCCLMDLRVGGGVRGWIDCCTGWAFFLFVCVMGMVGVISVTGGVKYSKNLTYIHRPILHKHFTCELKKKFLITEFSEIEKT